MEKAVIVACDFPSETECLEFLDLFGAEKIFVKIGMELFYAAGPDIIRKIKSLGHRIFLDLKLHDIPNTVKRTFQVLAALDVDMVNLHAAGGSKMMQAALEGLEAGSRCNQVVAAENQPGRRRPYLIAVTQLTSTDSTCLNEELLIEGAMEEVVRHYAQNAYKSGLDGVVCSPLEASAVKKSTGESFLTVTPGIRFAGQEGKDDQKRVMTPAKARVNDCDFIVVGRPITKAEDPVAAYRKCKREFLSI